MSRRESVPVGVVEGVRALAEHVRETADRVQALEDRVPREWRAAVVHLRRGLRSDAPRLRSLARALGGRP